MGLSSLKVRLIPVLAALAIMLVPLAQRAENHWRVAQQAEAAQRQLPALAAAAPTPLVQGLPVRIVVPSVNIDLPVVKNGYSRAAAGWVVAPSAANYAANTALINNQKGQTLIYGHNNPHVFGPLLNLKPGALAFVYTANKHVFEYEYKNFQDISPSQTTIFKQMSSAGPGLKLITCDGAYFQYRHFMSFRLVKNS